MTFTSAFSHWHRRGHGKAPTPIELIQGSLFPQLIAQDLTRVIYVCWHTGEPSLFTQLSMLSRQRRHRSQWMYRHYAYDPIVRGWDPASIIPPHSRWPVVPASSIFHYCVTVAASLSTPSVMYDLTLHASKSHSFKYKERKSIREAAVPSSGKQWDYKWVRTFMKQHKLPQNLQSSHYCAYKIIIFYG